jgi:two-component system LytT family sensor kinase
MTDRSAGGARGKAWIWYALAWIPVALFYAIPMARTRPMSVAQALAQGFSHVLPAALLGVGVWALTRIIDWPPRDKWRFTALHVLGAAVFSAAWLSIEVGMIAIATGFSAAIELSKIFAGFQAIDGVFVYALIAAASYVIRIATRLRQQEARAARADAARMSAELSALRGQLNPHFLFNTLHTLTALVRRDPATAEHALEQFGGMLRYVLDVKRSAREDVTLADEMQFIRDYLSLEALRLGDRLCVVEHLDPDALDCVLPSLTLQPLVENAIKYGIAPRSRGGSLSITASVDDETLTLEVRDDGPGARSDVVASAGGVGLRAVRQRLDTRYEGRAHFVVTTAPGEGFIARVTLPAHTGAATIASPATV